MKFFVISLICLINLINCQILSSNSEQYLGDFPTYAHGLSGQLFAVYPDLRQIHIKNLNYDGTAPDAYFWAGTSAEPDTTGFIIPDEKGSTQPLKGYRNADIVLTLPDGKTLRDIKWLSVWCRRYRVNFGNISFQ